MGPASVLPDAQLKLSASTQMNNVNDRFVMIHDAKIESDYPIDKNKKIRF